MIDPDSQQEKIRTSQRIGDEYHLAHGTVEKYGTYSKAVDAIAKKDPTMLPRILSGRYKISHDNVVALSRMLPSEVKKFGRQMKAMKKSSVYVPYGVARTQLGQVAPEPPVQVKPEIKNMPDFDPDAEVTGLTLTIPSWATSLSRTRSNTDLSSISLKARMNLEHALFNLQATIEELLQAIKE